MNVTIKKLDKWGACRRKDGERYSDENLKRLFAGKRSLSPMEALAKRIPVEDKIWLGPWMMTEKQTRAWLDLIVTRAVKNHALHCGIAEVETWAVKWLAGEDRSEQAGRAAWAASAAAEAAEAAARAAAWAWAAAEAAQATERKRQIRDLRKILKGG